MDWLMMQPAGARGTPIAWDAVGLAIARIMSNTNGERDQDLSRALRSDLADRVNRRKLRLDDALVAPWLVRQFPGDPEAALLGMVTLATLWSSQQIRLTWRDVMGREFLAIAATQLDQLKRQPQLFREYLAMLARELEWDRVLELAGQLPDAGEAAAAIADLVQLITELKTGSERDMAAARRQALAEPVASPDFPRFSEDD